METKDTPVTVTGVGRNFPELGRAPTSCCWLSLVLKDSAIAVYTKGGGAHGFASLELRNTKDSYVNDCYLSTLGRILVR